jgi:uncharacterized protein
MRIVLDTNVLVSALLNPFGKPAVILGLVVEEKVTVCFDARIMAEYFEVLNRPNFGFSSGDVGLLLDFIKETGSLYTPHTATPSLRDPSDAPFAQMCLASNADALVTGNIRHFPGKIGRTPVVNPAGFLERFFGKKN